MCNTTQKLYLSFTVDFSIIHLVERKERDQIFSHRYIIYAEIKYLSCLPKKKKKKHLSCDERGVTAAIYKLSGHRYSLGC